MAYSISCSCGDNGSVTAYNSGSWQTYNLDAGDSIYYTGFSGYSTFTATGDSGYELDYWTLSIDGGTSTYPTDTSLTIYASEVSSSISISATFKVSSGGGGGGEEEEGGDWDTSTTNLGEVQTEYTVVDWVEYGQVECMKMYFATAGTATFQTLSDDDYYLDTYGILASSALEFDESGNVKSAYSGYVLQTNDDGGENNNCKITYSVAADTYYYFYVRAYGSSEGVFYFNIVPPDVKEFTKHMKTQISVGSVARSGSVTATYQAGYVWVLPLYFTKKGTCVFYTDMDSTPTNTDDTMGYVVSENVGISSTTGDPSYSPTNLVTYDDDSGDKYRMCKMTATVQAGKTYYFYVRLWSVSYTSVSKMCYSYTPINEYTVTLKHYKGSTLQQTTTVTVDENTTFVFTEHTISITGYSYSHAEDTSGAIQETNPTITSAVTYNLYYVSGDRRVLKAYLDGNAYKVSITYNGVTATTMTTLTPAQLNVPANAMFTISYTPKQQSTSWYKFYGFYSAASGGGSCYGTEYSLQLKMPTTDTSIYCYAVLQSSKFAWTYAKTQGKAFNLTAQEWKDMWDCIQTRKGAAYSHTSPEAGKAFTATQMNEALTATGHSSLAVYVPGNTITALLMNNLVTYVNNTTS